MATRIERPLFYEGQILAAADLTTTVDYGRDQSARDRRYLHTAGVAAGLKLTKVPRRTSGGDDYVEVMLEPGVAIDGTGLQVIVAERTRLDEREFLNARVLDGPTAWYPVFLTGIEEPSPMPPLAMGGCASQGMTRITESFSVSFGRPTDAAPAESPPPDVTEGPGGSRDVPGTPVLVGFVQWNRAIGTGAFRDVADISPEGRRQYAGVLADEVVARGGALTLRSAPRPSDRKATVIIDDTDGGQLRFGVENAQGRIEPVLTVTSKGDVQAKGTISSPLLGINVESGIISDGLIIPLPKDVKEELVTEGQVKLHVHLTPRYQGPDPAQPGKVPLVVDCRVDGDRRVTCWIRWIDVPGATNPVDAGGSCDYTIIAQGAPPKPNVPAGSGGSPP
jgi:hypothetical protein